MVAFTSGGAGYIMSYFDMFSLDRFKHISTSAQPIQTALARLDAEFKADSNGAFYKLRG